MNDEKYRDSYSQPIIIVLQREVNGKIIEEPYKFDVPPTPEELEAFLNEKFGKPPTPGFKCNT